MEERKERVIAREQWTEFCTSFSRKHRGWMVSVTAEQVKNEYLRIDKIVADGATLDEIALESELNKRFRIVVSRESKRMVIHVDKAERLINDHKDGGCPLGIRLESADGYTTMVRFEHPAAPEAENRS